MINRLDNWLFEKIMSCSKLTLVILYESFLILPTVIFYLLGAYEKEDLWILGGCVLISLVSIVAYNKFEKYREQEEIFLFTLMVYLFAIDHSSLLATIATITQFIFIVIGSCFMVAYVKKFKDAENKHSS